MQAPAAMSGDFRPMLRARTTPLSQATRVWSRRFSSRLNVPRLLQVLADRLRVAASLPCDYYGLHFCTTFILYLDYQLSR
jgi:hypothetical protein